MGRSGSGATSQLDHLIAILESGATPEQKASAERSLLQYGVTHGQDQVNAVLRTHNMQLGAGHVMYYQNGQWVPMAQSNGQPFDYSSGDPGTINPRAMGNNAWRQAVNSVSQADSAMKSRRLAGNQPAQRTTPTDGSGGSSFGAVDLNGDGIPDTSGASPSTGGGLAGTTPSALNGGTDPNSFFGGVTGDAINELAGDPNQAWALYQTRGGPNRGDLSNSSVTKYGQNDFQAAMALAPYLNGPGGGGGGAGTLDFTGKMMDQSLKPGTYVDPSKVFDATLSHLTGQPVSTQEQGITDLLNNMGAYMDPTQFQMLKARVNQVMNQYITQGLEGGSANQSGQLLQMVRQAAGF